MSFLELAKKRYSLRKMDTSRPIEKEVLDKILEAARVAPTARNAQCPRILVVNTPEGVEQMRECTPCHFQSPCILAIFFDKEISKLNDNPLGKEEYGRVDAGIAAAQMMLEAADLGVGSTCVGDFNTTLLRQKFNVPEKYTLVCLLPLGYPREGGKPSRLHEDRQPIEQTVTYNKF